MAPAAVRTYGGGGAGLDNDNSTSLGNIAVKVRQRGEEKRCHGPIVFGSLVACWTSGSWASIFSQIPTIFHFRTARFLP
jgi:hypothetical protein